jgi:hypothetical protein
LLFPDAVPFGRLLGGLVEKAKERPVHGERVAALANVHAGGDELLALVSALLGGGHDVATMIITQASAIVGMTTHKTNRVKAARSLGLSTSLALRRGVGCATSPCWAPGAALASRRGRPSFWFM